MGPEGAPGPRGFCSPDTSTVAAGGGRAVGDPASPPGLWPSEKGSTRTGGERLLLTLGSPRGSLASPKCREGQRNAGGGSASVLGTGDGPVASSQEGTMLWAQEPRKDLCTLQGASTFK